MLALSFNVEKYLGGDDRAPDVLTLTCMFFFLNFLAATQEPRELLEQIKKSSSPEELLKTHFRSDDKVEDPPSPKKKSEEAEAPVLSAKTKASIDMMARFMNDPCTLRHLTSDDDEDSKPWRRHGDAWSWRGRDVRGIVLR